MHDSRDDKPDFVDIMLYFEVCSARECCAVTVAVADSGIDASHSASKRIIDSHPYPGNGRYHTRC
ncbi:MAG: hypothetical protein OXI96_07575 [Acidimicrobiaceae bacterium]|nr:hypothetical protein [Acidimicrobiaceae bacterium]